MVLKIMTMIMSRRSCGSDSGGDCFGGDDGGDVGVDGGNDGNDGGNDGNDGGNDGNDGGNVVDGEDDAT